MTFHAAPFRSHWLLAAALGSAPCFVVPAQAQSLLDLFRQNNASSYAPADDGSASIPPPLSIIPVNPRAGDVEKKDAKAANAKGKDSKGAVARQPIETPVPASNPELEEDDSESVLEHEQPKLVTIFLPVPRPGGKVRTAAEVAPVGAARWSEAKDQLAPGVNLPGASIAPPAAPRLASLPATQSIPRWTQTDEGQIRPPGLRESETPVPNMPGVFAPPEANFQCLPDGVKQVLLDTAAKFGHVAILNAKRPRGTGARASYHYQCRAVDFRVRGVPVSTVYAYLRQHPNVGGRKIYPFGFFHVDDGPSRSW